MIIEAQDYLVNAVCVEMHQPNELKGNMKDKKVQELYNKLLDHNLTKDMKTQLAEDLLLYGKCATKMYIKDGEVVVKVVDMKSLIGCI